MPNWKKVIVSGSNAVLNNITASGHLTALDGGFTVNTAAETELEVDGNISGSGELEVGYRKLNISNNQNDYNGDVVFFGGEGTGYGQGLLVYYDGDDWVRTDNALGADPMGTSLLGIALGSSVSTSGVLIRGFYSMNVGTSLFDPGDALYMGASGQIQTVAPSSTGQISRIIGNVVSTPGGIPSKIYFNPSPDWIEISA